MHELMVLLNTLIGICNKQNLKVNDEILEIKNRIYKKESNLKLERARLTGRMILNKAIASGANIIAVEDLNINSSTKNSKWMNIGLRRWYVSRIVNFLKDEAIMHGIYVREINPNYSSHRDIDGSPMARLIKVNPQTLPEVTVKGKRYPSIKSIENRLQHSIKGVGLSETDKIYAEESKRFLSNHSFEELLLRERNAGSTMMYVPWRAGEYSNSKVLGVVHSDELAACVLSQRACERLDGSKKPPTSRKPQVHTQKQVLIR